MADTTVMDKSEDIKHDSDESLESGDEGGPIPAAGNHTAANAPDGQPVKRKGGRKPIYATSEERKQRNRQAQAAFRERRTEYIKQLEETIRVHEQNLHNLQTAHRHAADECLMLRYKNSLLERILLEKGIDVQAELRAKTGSPNLGPTHMPQNLVQPPPIPRAILNRHHARRSNSSIAPKLEPGVNALPGHPTPTSVVTSPKSRPTPSSHSASPTASTSAYGASPASTNDPSSCIRPVLAAPPPQSLPHVHQVQQAGPPGLAAMKANQMASLTGMMGPMQPRTMQQQQQQQQQQRQQQRQQAQQNMQQQRQQQALQHQQHQTHQTQLPPPQPATPRSTGVGPNAYYPVPSFQNHIEQLGKLTQQEYDAVDDMIEDPTENPDTPSGPYPNHSFSTGPPPLSLASPATSAPPSSTSSVMGGQNGYPSMTQLLDPALDWDPFGLSASMQFPTQFSFDTSNTR